MNDPIVIRSGLVIFPHYITLVKTVNPDVNRVYLVNGSAVLTDAEVNKLFSTLQKRHEQIEGRIRRR